MKTSPRLLALGAIALLAAACSDHTPQQLQPMQAAPQAQMQSPQQVQQVPGQPNVVVVQQPAQQSNSGVGDMVMGGALGYMLGSAMNGGNNNTQVRERTVYVERETPARERAPSSSTQIGSNITPPAAPAAAPASVYSNATPAPQQAVVPKAAPIQAAAPLALPAPAAKAAITAAPLALPAPPKPQVAALPAPAAPAPKPAANYSNQTSYKSVTQSPTVTYTYKSSPSSSSSSSASRPSYSSSSSSRR